MPSAFVIPSSTGLLRPRLQPSGLSWSNESIKIEPGTSATPTIKLEPGTSKWSNDVIKLETSGSRSPVTLSISQVFACAQPLPLQEDAKHNGRGKMTTLADLEPRTTPMTFTLSQPSTISLKSPQQQQQGPQLFRRVITAKDLQTSSTLASLTPATTALTTTSSSTTATTVLLKNQVLMKPFRCEHPGCNKSFDKPTLLRRHSKLHSSECKFVCDVCSKCFESQSKLDDHYRKHTGAKPFSCHICHNTFRYKGNLNFLKLASA